MDNVTILPISHHNVEALIAFNQRNPTAKILQVATLSGIKLLDDPVRVLSLQQRFGSWQGSAVATNSDGEVLGYIWYYRNDLEAAWYEFKVGELFVSPDLSEAEAEELRNALIAHAREVSGW